MTENIIENMIEKTYATPSGTIHYWMSNPQPGKPTLVFLPGLTADHRLFNKQIEYFAGKFHVLIWDAPGHGASRPFSLNFTLMDKARWLHEILTLEKIKRPVLIGQSMGGYVSQAYLEQFPEDAAGFVSIDSAPLKRHYTSGVEIFLLKHCEGMYRCYPWKALQRDGAKGCAVSQYGRQLMADMISDYEKNEYCKLAGHGMGMLAEAMEANLKYRLTCPTLLICGQNDMAGSAKKYNKNWAACEKLPIRWIKDAGHNSNTDNPDLINQIILDFAANL